MDDPNKKAKEAFQRLLESGELSSSAYLPSRLQLQRVVWDLQKENKELRGQIERLEERITTTTKDNSKCCNAGRCDDCKPLEG